MYLCRLEINQNFGIQNNGNMDYGPTHERDIRQKIRNAADELAAKSGIQIVDYMIGYQTDVIQAIARNCVLKLMPMSHTSMVLVGMILPIFWIRSRF